MITSLELSKQLYEKGLKIENSFWVWITPIYTSKFYKEKGEELPDNLSYVERMGTIEEENPETPFQMNRGNLSCYRDDEFVNWEICPAYSTDELLEVLPQYIYDRQNMLTIVKNDDETYWVGYSNQEGVACKKKFSEKLISEALGKMCLWLFEQGYILKDGKLVGGER